MKNPKKEIATECNCVLDNEAIDFLSESVDGLSEDVIGLTESTEILMDCVDALCDVIKRQNNKIQNLSFAIFLCGIVAIAAVLIGIIM